jgi:predicted O-methyltransferase YrrM
MNKFLTPSSYRRKVRHLYFKLYEKLFFNREEIIMYEREKFSLINLSEKDGHAALHAALQNLRKGVFDRSIDSVHWLLFGCLSKSEGKFPRILEIGTSDGTGTRILSELFKKSEIITIDLPDNDPLTRSFYGRSEDDKFKKYLQRQEENVSAVNVKLLKVNSFFLLDHVTGPFDLIWVDGGHLYPDIAWDLSNVWHLCRKGGYILVDDVIPINKDYRTKLVSTDSSRVIDYIKERADVRVTYFLKRTNAASDSSKYRRKYVALLERP